MIERPLKLTASPEVLAKCNAWLGTRYSEASAEMEVALLRKLLESKCEVLYSEYEVRIVMWDWDTPEQPPAPTGETIYDAAAKYRDNG